LYAGVSLSSASAASPTPSQGTPSRRASCSVNVPNGFTVSSSPSPAGGDSRLNT
ncbi:hypothetical protein KL950_005409, partial [Ogataea haglerorum]